MPATNIIANLFATLYNCESRRKHECVVLPTSKIAINVLTTLKKGGYVGDFEHVKDKVGGKLKINLLRTSVDIVNIFARIFLRSHWYLSGWSVKITPLPTEIIANN